MRDEMEPYICVPGVNQILYLAGGFGNDLFRSASRRSSVNKKSWVQPATDPKRSKLSTSPPGIEELQNPPRCRLRCLLSSNIRYSCQLSCMPDSSAESPWPDTGLLLDHYRGSGLRHPLHGHSKLFHLHPLSTHRYHRSVRALGPRPQVPPARRQ